MLFPTYSFLFFFVIVFFAYWYIFRQKKSRVVFLIVASFVFYAFSDYRFCLLLLISCIANYLFAYYIINNNDNKRKAILVISVVFNLLILGFFKYFNFFIDSINSLLSLFSKTTSDSFIIPTLNIILPLGLSFYTFKAMSLCFDSASGKITKAPNLLEVMLYISFFPQLASGPIARASQFIPQIDIATSLGQEADSRPIDFDKASVLILGGLFKKLVIANFLSTLLVEPVFFNIEASHSFEVMLASFAYSSVIYCDFSAYSDMAIGLALLLGFKTDKNFDKPYRAFSVSDFWKRWHISLSSWLRDYLYFAMGGSRQGKIKTCFALIVTMLVSGLWHGASWMFILWGFVLGLALAIERLLGISKNKPRNICVSMIRTVFTFVFITFSWVIFRSSSFYDFDLWFKSLGNFSGSFTHTNPLVIILLVFSLLFHFVPDSFNSFCLKTWRTIPFYLKTIVFAVFFICLSLISMSGVAPFIYFGF